MKRQLCAAMLAFVTVVPLAAQAPEGWKLRADRSTSASDPDAPGDIKFVRTATGFHANNPQAAVYWHPANQATGNYSLKGTFTLVKPSGHTNYYGLLFGGSNLEGARQTYLYFMVAQDGTFLIKKREGDATTRDVSERVASGAVRKPDAKGTSTNELEVRVRPDRIEYLVNGTTVHTTPKTGLTSTTAGTYGIRVNHQLEVRVDSLSLSTL